MENTASKLISIAASEVGYHEKASNANLDSQTGNSGSNNWTKYARDLNAAGYYNGNKNGYDWCDVFVDWCFYKLTGSKAKAEDMECQTGTLGAGCTYSAGYYRNAGRFYTANPQAGDQIFFGKYGNESHTGIVEKVVGNYVYTIEGNANNEVGRHTYPLGYSTISGYGRPKYDAEETPAQTGGDDVQVRTVTNGSKGNDVKTLQAALKGLGYYSGLVDGAAGNLTFNAIKSFQKARGLTVDGLCGPVTWGELLRQ